MGRAANPLAENDDAVNTTNSDIQYTLPATGTYFIVVTRFDVAAGFTDGEFRMTLASSTSAGGADASAPVVKVEMGRCAAYSGAPLLCAAALFNWG